MILRKHTDKTKPFIEWKSWQNPVHHWINQKNWILTNPNLVEFIQIVESKVPCHSQVALHMNSMKLPRVWNSRLWWSGSGQIHGFVSHYFYGIKQWMMQIFITFPPYITQAASITCKSHNSISNVIYQHITRKDTNIKSTAYVGIMLH